MKCKLTLRDQSKLTPEIEAWLIKVEQIINAETEKYVSDLIMYGDAMMRDGKHVPFKEWSTKL